MSSASSAKSTRSAARNLLLASLSSSTRRRILAHCERVELVIAAVLYQPREQMRYVFFPIDGFVSLLTPGDGDAPLEVGLAGSEGMLGVSVLLGVNAAPLKAIVQGAGQALRMEVAPFLLEVKRSRRLRRSLDRYLYVTLIQLAQSAACTRFHVVEARLARWLLMTRDRAHADQFHMTHEFLAYMLGVRRVGITHAARALQRRGLIRYHRGHLQILDARGLEAASCRCYAAGNDAYARVMRTRT
jgi:CRP-like cAMP-binding protein